MGAEWPPFRLLFKGEGCTQEGILGPGKATCEAQAPLSTSANPPSRVLTGETHTGVLHTCGQVCLESDWPSQKGGGREALPPTARNSAVPRKGGQAGLCTEDSSQRFRAPSHLCHRVPSAGGECALSQTELLM